MKNPDSEGAFLRKFRKGIGEPGENINVHYQVISFGGLENVEKYSLVSLWWKI